MSEIRPMTPADTAAVASWMAQIEPWVRYGANPERVQARLESGIAGGDVVLTADIDGAKARGLAFCALEGMFDRSTYLRWLAIHPDHSGKGIGAMLLDAVEEAVKQHDRDIFLLAADFNTGAQRFYERHGYRQMAVLPDYVVAGVAEVLYWKRLR
jgi:ribosomal protein S18 acetylase RimI-like enzyme